MYNEANLRELARLALSHDHAREGDEGGVELVLGDGGTQDARDRHDQEALCERLLLCQMAAMTLTLRDGGTWVCKVCQCVSRKNDRAPRVQRSRSKRPGFREI